MTGHDVEAPRTSIIWPLAAVAAFLVSTVLQLFASWERWVFAAGSWTRADRSIEDHLFDYWWPADPWENVGDAAQLYGIGMLLLAGGLLALGRAASAERDGFSVILVITAAASFAFTGLHALVSGMIGSPTPLQHLPMQGLLNMVGFVALVILVVRWFRTSWPAALTALLLLGSTLPGYLVACFVVAPMITGYQSFDTTPWTETVVAVSVGLATVAASLAVFVRPRRGDAATKPAAALSV